MTSPIEKSDSEVCCTRCKRPLRSPASIAAGIGPRCAAIEAAFEGLNAKQRAKAEQLIADKAIQRVRKGIWKMAGEGGAIHVAHVGGNCSCEWGRYRMTATVKTCYHVGLARLFDKPRRVLRRSDFVRAA